jgi:3-phosphoshikimate 1-carboxyvinyltransferase
MSEEHAPKHVARVKHPFEVALNLPGSKSITLRDFILAALADGTSEIRMPGICDDTDRMEDSLRRMGIPITKDECGVLHVEGRNGQFSEEDVDVYMGMSGTSTRLLLGVAALRRGKTRFDAHPSMLARPNKYLLDAIAELGAQVESRDDGYLPATLQGTGTYNRVLTMRGDRSSQYFSALMQIAPLLPEGLELRVDGELVSKPYIDITINEMKKYGVHVENHDYQRFVIAPQSYKAVNITVEGDASASSYWSALATVHGSTVIFENLGSSTFQGDFQFCEICKQLGADVTYEPNRTTITGPAGGQLLPLPDIDMESMPDVAPTLMAIAPFIPGTTRITGLSTLRIKECDRIAVPMEQLRKLGVPLVEGPDFVEIGELPSELPDEVEIPTHDDHRIAMSFAVLASKLGNLKILEPNCVEKTYPLFWADLAKIYK